MDSWKGLGLGKMTMSKMTELYRNSPKVALDQMNILLQYTDTFNPASFVQSLTLVDGHVPSGTREDTGSMFYVLPGGPQAEEVPLWGMGEHLFSKRYDKLNMTGKISNLQLKRRL